MKKSVIDRRNIPAVIPADRILLYMLCSEVFHWAHWFDVCVIIFMALDFLGSVIRIWKQKEVDLFKGE